MEQVAFLCIKKAECPVGIIYALGITCYVLGGERFLPIYLFENEEQIQDALIELREMIEIIRKYYTTDIPDSFLKAFEK